MAFPPSQLNTSNYATLKALGGHAKKTCLLDCVAVLVMALFQKAFSLYFEPLKALCGTVCYIYTYNLKLNSLLFKHVLIH